MQAILTWLDGKKSIILAICAPVVTYLMATHLITLDLGALIQTILSILAGAAKIATNDMQGDNKLGFRKD